MHIVFLSLFLFVLIQTAPAQNALKDCGRMEKEAIKSLMNGGTIDSTGQKKYVALNREWRECVTGKEIPPFIIKSISGREINSEMLRGKVVVINSWFTSCPPCIAEMPALNRLVEEYAGKDVLFLGVTHESKKQLKKNFFPKYKFDFIIIPDAQLFEDLIGICVHPSTFIIDKEGKIKTAWVGGYKGEFAYDKAKPIIDELLKAQ